MIHKHCSPVIAGDVEYVAKNMREADVEEVRALGSDPLTTLSMSVLASPLAYTLTDPNGDPAAILGVAPSYFEGCGLIWLLGTDAITRHPMTFLRNSKSVLNALFDETGYMTLHNVVYSKNTVHIQWLAWLGFQFQDPIDVNGHLFIPFYQHLY